MEAAVGGALEHFGELQVNDRLKVFLVQRVEDDQLVDPVQELGTKVVM